jgi:hypothetical protein
MSSSLKHNVATPMMMAKFKWQAYRIYESMGLGGKLAIIMLLGALLFYVGYMAPMQDALLRVQQNQIHAQTQPRQDTNQTALQDLQTYVAAFPKQTERANQINAMMALAKQSSLMLDEVTYKSKQVEGSLLTQTIIEFSMLDTYPKIYQYVDALLVEMPFVALDSLTLSRADVSDDIVEARVRFIFYFGAS